MKKHFNSVDNKCEYGLNIIKIDSNRDDDLYFNESYVVTGDVIVANDITAAYNLVILGNVEADCIDVHGQLTVIGDLRCDKLTAKKIICTGEILVKSITCDDEIMTDSIKIVDADLTGNLLVNKSMDVVGKFNCSKSVLVGEGIIGSDNYYANVTAVVDYFDVDCKDELNYVEISQDFKNVSNSDNESQDLQKKPFRDRLKSLIDSFFESIIDDDEEMVVKKIENLGKAQTDSFNTIGYILNKIIDISYLDGIENINQYLYAMYGKERFAPSLLNYETIEHVFSSFLKDVDISSLSCEPVDEFDFCMLLYINHCILDDNDVILDKIFSSVGIRYNTVKKQFVGASDEIKDHAQEDVSEDKKEESEFVEELVDYSAPQVGFKAISNAFGAGVIKGADSKNYVIDFEKYGLKKIRKEYVIIFRG